MKLINPIRYRLKRAQDAWLRSEARKQGHGNKAIILRQAIDRAMRFTGEKPANGKESAA